MYELLKYPELVPGINNIQDLPELLNDMHPDTGLSVYVYLHSGRARIYNNINIINYKMKDRKVHLSFESTLHRKKGKTLVKTIKALEIVQCEELKDFVVMKDIKEVKGIFP